MGSVLTVSQLNKYVKSIFESDHKIQDVYIKGEISNFISHYKSGHLYFTLKEGGCAIKSVMFASYAKGLRFEPENGMSVIVRCSVNIYERDGTYQIYVYEIQPEGKGDLQIAFEQLYRKLEKEGYFATEAKNPLPAFPETIGVITSENGAALQDILSIISRRYPIAKIVLYPSLVQGDGAPASIVDGIQTMNRLKVCDVIIMGRGGGSIEDLWAFNSEDVVKAVYNSKIPIISAVGHETDYTLCDYVADIRAATPSAAAELAVPNLDDVKYTFSQYDSRIEQAFLEVLSRKRQNLESILNRGCFKKSDEYLYNNTKKIEYFSKMIQSQIKNVILYKHEQLQSRAAVLEAVNPIARLASGYSITKDNEGRMLKSVEQVKPGNLISTLLHDGLLISQVVEIKPKQS